MCLLLSNTLNKALNLSQQNARTGGGVAGCLTWWCWVGDIWFQSLVLLHTAPQDCESQCHILGNNTCNSIRKAMVQRHSTKDGQHNSTGKVGNHSVRTSTTVQGPVPQYSDSQCHSTGTSSTVQWQTARTTWYCRDQYCSMVTIATVQWQTLLRFWEQYHRSVMASRRLQGQPVPECRDKYHSTVTTRTTA